MANPEISKIIGEQWRHLSDEEKNKWKALAEVSLRCKYF
jgi:HMG box factor